MAKEIRNYKGELISGIYELANPKFGTGKIDSSGTPEVDWSLLASFVDKNGFDTRNVEANGEYIIDYIIPKGTIIIRYGNPRGYYSAPVGSKYEELALPYKQDTVEYNEYEVISDDLKVHCKVTKGKVGPGFDSSGGAIQFHHFNSILKEIEDGKLERRVLW